ncbi:hypothetical protein [Deinococcus sp.]|nr:hypothetical protein [Deinococcus sp.]
MQRLAMEKVGIKAIGIRAYSAVHITAVADLGADLRGLHLQGLSQQ